MSKNDPNIAARFAVFRKEYIAKGQIEAAKLLGVSQSKISDIESGKLAMDFNIANRMAKDYGLNIDWLASGRGNLKKGDTGAPSMLQDMSALFVELESLKKFIQISQLNTNYLIKVIEKLDTRVAALEQLNAKLQKKKPA